MNFSQYVLDAIASIDYVSKNHDSKSISDIFETSKKAPNETDSHILEIVAGTYSMYYNGEEYSFGPHIIVEGKRTFALEDLDENGLDVLQSVIPITKSSYIRAKFSHVVWLLTKNNQYGDIAVNEYLDGFKCKFDPDEWVDCYDQIKPAYHIASTMGKKSECFKKIRSEINQKLNQLNGLDSSFLSLKLLKLIVKDAPKEDLIKYEPILDNLADRSFNINNGNAYLADETFSVFKKLNDRMNKIEKQKIIKERYANYYEAQSKILKNKNYYHQAVVLLKRACTLYSDINHEKLLELRLLLEDLQKKSLHEMKVRKFEFNLQSTYNAIEQMFDGLSLPEAIVQFGRFAKIYNADEIRNKLLEDQEQYVFTSMFGSVMLNEQGQSVQELPPFKEAFASGNTDIIEKHLIRYAAEQRGMVDMIPVNIAYQLLKKYGPITEEDLNFLAQENAIIPKNRVEIIKQGLCLGLNGKLYAAMHILQPQTENLFRNLVKMCEDTVTFLKENGTEEYKPLSTLFKSTKLLDCYDNNIIFTFHSMMDEPAGENLRNLTSHGLLEPELGNSPVSLYFLSLLIFWLSLYSSQACLILDKLIKQKQADSDELNENGV